MKKTAIIGGGIAGLTAAWQLHQLGQSFTLYEATDRLGGTVRTIHREGFIIELGPDGWVTEKPWAAQLARDLGLADQFIPSNDATRVTYILNNGRLIAMPDGMRMMVPTNLEALAASPLFTPEAIAAYDAEPTRALELREHALRTISPDQDESVASFVARHFGREVLDKLAAPLLSGVFGGNVSTLSVRAVMPAFVQMERDHGSLIAALQAKARTITGSIFTTLATGTQTLIDRMAAALPPDSIHLNTPIINLGAPRLASKTWVSAEPTPWQLQSPTTQATYDHLILATPAHVTRQFLSPIIPATTDLLHLEATSAVIAAFAFNQPFDLPQGFGFLVPFTEPSPLLACTFTDQKFPYRAPTNQRLIRAFFGGASTPTIAALPDEEIATLALAELRKILGPLPNPAFSLIQRWPQSLPQYAVGHIDRTAELMKLLPPNLHLLGNAYHGVGLPDLIRDARDLAHRITA